MPRLRVQALDLSNNKLSGALPSYWGNGCQNIRCASRIRYHSEHPFCVHSQWPRMVLLFTSNAAAAPSTRWHKHLFTVDTRSL